jgi:hypothetical protein
MALAWVYFKIGVGEFDAALDHLTREVLPGLAATAQARRWFYLRYFDEVSGLHLRFRLQVEAERREAVLQTVGSQLRDFVQQVPTLALPSYQPMVELLPMQPSTHPLLVIEDVYEEEFGKFGGRDAMDDAHAWFEASSIIAIEALRLEDRSGYSRKTLAPILMDVVVQGLSLARSSEDFFEEYALSWLPPELAQRLSLRDEFFDKASQLFDRGVSIVQPEHERPQAVRDLVESWRKAVRRARERYLTYPKTAPEFISTQAWQMIHLTNNRLGLSALEEAYLATLLEAHHRVQQRHAA